MPLATLPSPTPTPDELDDLIYFSRTGDLDSLRDLISELCKRHACPPAVILASAIDVDAEGLGSQSSLLHYPAANGNLKVVQFLLSQLTGPGSSGANGTIAGESAPDLVNHRNVNGNTPLHWAGMNGHLEVVKVLVGAGADPTIVNGAGKDAVVESEASAKEGARECADWMLKNCDGLDKGIGGAKEEEGPAVDEYESGPTTSAAQKLPEDGPRA